MTNEYPVFNSDQMAILVHSQEDLFTQFKELVAVRGFESKVALECLFNTYVIDDTNMTYAYENVGAQ